MGDVAILCDRIIETKAEGDNEGASQMIDELIMDCIDPRAEFSSAALQVVCEKGLLELVAA